MTWFHKTLIDAEVAVQTGNFDKARSIIEDHLKTEHSLYGTFAGAMRDMSTFQSDLMSLERSLPSLNHSVKINQAYTNDITERIRNLKGALVNLQFKLASLAAGMKEEE